MKTSNQIYKKYPTMYQFFTTNGKVSFTEFYNNKRIIVTDDFEDYKREISKGYTRYSEYDTVCHNNNNDCTFMAFRDKISGYEEMDFIHSNDVAQCFIKGSSGFYQNRDNCYHYYAEGLFYENGRPYYKIPNHMLPVIINTTSNIKINSFKMPYNVFSVVLPSDNMTGIDYFMVYALQSRIMKDWNNKKAAHIIPTPIVDFSNVHLARKEDEDNFLDDDVIRINFIGARQHRSDIFVSSLYIKPWEMNMTIGQIYEKYAESQDIDINMIKLYISVCILATASHKMFEPDIMENLLAEYRNEKTPQKRRNKIVKQSKEKGFNGFVIGAVDTEKRLPNGVKITEKSIYDADSYVARCPHVRCGHYRYQACGKHYENHKLIWIDPTFVYPRKQVQVSEKQ